MIPMWQSGACFNATLPPKRCSALCKKMCPITSLLIFFSAGYPCQPYSVLGTGDGLESEDGKVLLYVLQRIRLTRPRTFLLENVKNFQKFKKAYELVRDVLKALKDLALVCEISWASGFQHDHVLNLDLQCCRGKEPCALGRTLVANHTTSCRQEF